jgi:hypothetical protein
MTEYFQAEIQAGSKTNTFLLQLTWSRQNVSQLDPDTVIGKISSKYTALQSIAVQLESHTTKQDKMIATLQGKYLYLYLKVVFHR